MKYTAFATKNVTDGAADSWYVTYKTWPEENSTFIFVTHGATTLPADLIPIHWDKILKVLPKSDTIELSGESGLLCFDIEMNEWRRPG